MRLFSSITATIFAGIITVAGSVYATLLQNRHSLALERERFEATKSLEGQKFASSEKLEIEKQQHELILKMIAVDNIEQAQRNVRFLAETELITNKELAKRLLAAKETPLIKPVAATPVAAAPAPAMTVEELRRLVSDEALAMMIAAEFGGDRDRYNPHPHWVGVAGGITIGIGYDLGYVSADKFKQDWSAFLSQPDIAQLTAAIGIKGAPAEAIAAQFSGIEIRRDDAISVFHGTLPSWATALERNVPNMRDLPPDAYGALLSLVYNRGTPFKSTGERFTEMREIRALMEKKDFTGIPQQLRAMKRLWPTAPGLMQRRESEAKLFEKGLAQLSPPSRAER